MSDFAVYQCSVFLLTLELCDDVKWGDFQNGFTSLADMKQLWKDRKFSYIYEASPTTHVGLFMQSLYGHTLGKINI